VTLILITRPEPGAAETAARLAAAGIGAVLAPGLVLTPRAFRLPSCQAVLVTSRAGARALPAPIPGVPVLAVGAASAAPAAAAGWATLAAEGTAESLAALAAARLDPGAGPLLLAVGQGYALDLAAALRGRGFRVIRRIAYAATPGLTLPEPAMASLRGGCVTHVLFHSPRSAWCAIRLFAAAGLLPAVADGVAVAISPRVALAARQALAPLAFRAVAVASRPSEDALLGLLGRQGQGPLCEEER
jgi:uroporphyrinogen-III synthase